MADSNPYDQFNQSSGNPYDAFDPKKFIHADMPEWLFEHGERANILHNFGQGAAQGWGAEPLGLSPESEQTLRNSGIFNELEDGHKTWLRTLNEAMLRPLALGGEVLLRGGSALLRGTQAATEAAGYSLEHPSPGTPFPAIPGAERVGRTVAAVPEAFPRGMIELGVPSPRTVAAPEGYPAATEQAIRSLTPPDLSYARALGVIGEGEGGWKGTIESGPRGDEARAASIRQAREAAVEPPAPPAPETPPPPDVHSIARQLAPDAFAEYDALGIQQDTLRRQLGDLAEMQGQGTSPAIERQMITAAMQTNERRMRDLSPAVSDAYRRAAQMEAPPLELPRVSSLTVADVSRETMPGAAEALRVIDANEFRQTIQANSGDMGAASDSLAEDLKAELARGRSVTLYSDGKPIPITSIERGMMQDAQGQRWGAMGLATDKTGGNRIEIGPAPGQRPSVLREAPVPSPDIHADVQQQLIAAGRPPEEANAAAALVASHYEARAARFEGQLGSAGELYTREAPAVEAAAQGRAGEMGRTVLDDGQATIRLMGHADASTFIHETAHNWLEELIRDAADERAPADLTKDAASVRSWLGVGEDEQISRRAHEKFARGFERYMMEGRAPSQPLAGVFDQFKQWLTQIYQTVGRLRAPITDDIRDVYNRLLSIPDRTPVIARDMEIPRNFAQEHENLAQTVHPETAFDAAERVRAEADRVATEQAPEVYSELVGRGAEPRIPSATSSGRTATGGEPGGYGTAPGPGGAEAAAAEPTGEVGAGGGAAAPQGARLVPTADRPFATPGTPAEPRIADRAGNIRLDLLGTPEDVNQAIRDTAAENGDFLGARRGAISDAEVLRLADALGMDASQLNLRKIGQAFNAEEIVAARRLLISSAQELREVAGRAMSGSDQAVMEYAAAKSRHQMIQEQVSGITAESGRALRAFREMAPGMAEAQEVGRFIEETSGRTLFQLRKEAAALYQLRTSAQVSKLVADSVRPGFFDWLQSYFVNALISGPATHGTYMIGNTLLGLFKAVPETAASAAAGAIRRSVAPGFAGAERIRAGEIPAQIYGAMKGQRDGWTAAWRSFLSNQTAALPGEKMVSGSVFTRGQIIPTPIGTVLESPSRVVTALHALTRTVSNRMSISGQAYRVAADEGLTGNALAARIRFLETNPTDAMMAEAVKSANENALMQRAPYGSITAAVQRITNAGFPVPDIPLPAGYSVPMGTLRPLKFIDPFVAISSNILKSAAVERTPLGLLSPEIRADLSGANGGVAFDRAAGRMLAGTSFYIMAGGLAAMGWLTDSGPSDHRQSAMKRLTGWMAHGVKIGDAYYDIHRLGPIGMQLGIAADLYGAAHALAKDDMLTASHLAVHAFAQNILDESFMRGPSELLQALVDPDRYGASFIRNFLSSFVPFSVGASQIARVVDPYTRQARTVADAMLRKIPYVSESLAPVRDIWGEPIPNKESLVPGLTAIYQSRINHDPVNQKMVALGMAPAPVERKIRGVDLTPQQYDDYARIAGRMAKSRLDQIVPQPSFSQQPEFAQREIISKTLAASREMARANIMMGNPDILKQAITHKISDLHK